MLASEEVGNNCAVLKDMRLGVQRVVSQNDIVKEVEQVLAWKVA